MDAQILSVVRTVLKVVGGWLVLNGVASEETANQFMSATTEIVMGLVPFATGVVWSWITHAKKG